ncbi:hypothetical protein ACLB1S_08525 [Escherichia coli]
MAQAWAGTGFGHLAIPRVGQEVVETSSTAIRTSRSLWAHLPPGKPHPRQPAGNKDADDHPLQNVHGQRI